MTQLTLNDEQSRLIAGASFPIVVIDSQGRELGRLSPTTSHAPHPSADDDWAEAKRQMEIARREGGTFYTTQEVLDHLKSLEGK
jgi:hypothetical protein